MGWGGVRKCLGLVLLNSHFDELDWPLSTLDIFENNKNKKIIMKVTQAC